MIRLSENVGFARANNIAARAAGAFDTLALLNPDAVAESGWLEALMGAAAREPTVAAFASQMRLAADPAYLDGAGDSYHVSGRAWRNGHRMPFADWATVEADVFAPCAAAALYRRAAFEEVGGFDEDYFCYFEDVDLGFRLRLLGYRSLYVPTAIVDHVSSALSGYRSDFSVYHGERNSVWTFIKDMPGPLMLTYLPQHLALNIAALLYYPWRGQGRVVLRAKLDALRGVAGALRGRRRVQRTRRIDVLGSSPGHVWRHHDTVRREASQELHDVSRRCVIPSLATMYVRGRMCGGCRPQGHFLNDAVEVSNQFRVGLLQRLGTVPFASRLSFHVRRKMFRAVHGHRFVRGPRPGCSTWA